MDIKAGDKVRFLNDVGGGVVVKLLPKDMAVVRDSDDFEYPVQLIELVLVEKAAEAPKVIVQPKAETVQTQVNEKQIKKSTPDYKNDNITEILFGFVRIKDELVDGFDCYLVNDSDFSMFYHVVYKGETGFKKLDAEVLDPNTKICIGSLSREQINTGKEIIIQILFFDHPHQTLHEQVERKIKIVPLKFFQEHVFKDNDFFDDKAYIFELLKEKPGLGQSVKSEEDFERMLAEKDSEPEEDLSRRFAPRKEAATIEVDLHINQLVESVVGMSNAEIVQKQMDVFHKTMTDAILSKAGKVILIHGIGNGTLKTAIRESLSVQYKLGYEDASFREYGFGATMVIL
jgi:hypothetical protein